MPDSPVREEAARLLRGLPPTPWEMWSDDTDEMTIGAEVVRCNCCTIPSVEMFTPIAEAVPEDVAEFIAAAPTLVADLLALTASDRSEIEQAREAVKLLLVSWMVTGVGVGYQDILHVAGALGLNEGVTHHEVLQVARAENERRAAVSTGLAPEPEPGDVKEDVTASIESVAGASPQAAPEARKPHEYVPDVDESGEAACYVCGRSRRSHRAPEATT